MNRRIAIIEDDAAIAQMYRLKFESERYKVEVAQNGKLGLEMVGKFKPRVILLDLMMPEMNGDEMLKKLRSKPWGSSKKIKVVVLTNIGEEEIPPGLREMGVDQVIMKAYHTPAQVVSLVEKALA